MTRYLLAIVLLMTAFKYTTDVSALDYNKCDFVEINLQAEEENKQGKAETGKSKIDDEDHYFSSPIFPALLPDSISCLKFSSLQAASSCFVNSPNTPPPDTI